MESLGLEGQGVDWSPQKMGQKKMKKQREVLGLSGFFSPNFI